MIIGFIGMPRTGKTLFMVFHALQMFKLGHIILANFTLKEPFVWTRMTPYDMLKIPFSVMDRDNKTLLIQEADKWFNSRRSMSNENYLLGGLTGQSGKRNLNIFWDTQYPHLVDNQLRLVTEVVFHTAVYIDNNTKEPLAFQYTRETANGDIQTLPLIPAEFFKPFYEMYDSYDPTATIIKRKTRKELSEMYE